MPYPLAAAHGRGSVLPFTVLGLAGLKLWLKSDAGLTLNTTGYAGTGVVSQTGTTLTGVASAFLTEVVIGDTITAVGINETVTAIADNTHLTLSASLSSGAGLTYTITPTAGASDRVSTWADQSGQGNNATQGDATARPSKKLSLKNGLPGLRMDGGNDTLALVGIAPSLAGFTLFLVASRSAVIGAALLQFDSADSLNPSILSNVGGVNFIYQNSSANNLSVGATSVNVMAVSHDDTGNYDRGYFNSGATVFDVVSGGPVSGLPLQTIGGDGVGSSFAKSDFCEIIMCVPALSAADITATMAYLAGRWA